MFNSKWKKLAAVASLSLALVAAGCGQEDESSNEDNQTGANSNVSKTMEYTITGIEPGAGQTELNEQAITEYESLAGWEQTTSSTGAMLSALDQAISNEEPIMFTAWTPHYMFAKWDLKFLDDPKGIFGEEQTLGTIVRNGLKEDMPDAFTIIDRFQWDISVVNEALFLALEEELEMDVLAQRWVDENQEEVAKWTEGVAPVDGTSIELVATTWDAEVFTANVAKVVLAEQGYDVTLTPVDPAVLFKSIATGDADASLSPSLPTSHGPLYEQYEGEFIDLGPNVEGAILGLAVPAYMDVDSLEDFEPAE